MTFTIWVAGPGDYTLVCGRDRPRFADGTAQSSAHRILRSFEAPSWAEAVEEFDRFVGQEP